jgi:hypothetical protein
MLLFSEILLLLVSAVTSRRELLLNRVAIIILLYSGIIGYDSLYVTYLDTGISIYNGLFHSITQNFNLYLMSIVPILSYSNADTMKPEVLKDNRNKTGIYR